MATVFQSCSAGRGCSTHKGNPGTGFFVLNTFMSRNTSHPSGRHVLVSALAAIIWVAAALPYAAPTICEVLDRPGSSIMVSLPGDDATVSTPDSMDHCCTFECGIAHVAPATYASTLDANHSLYDTFVTGDDLLQTHAPIPATPPPIA